MCCILCFSAEPHPDDPKAGRLNQFQITMMDGLYKNQPVCCLTYFCAPCSTYYTRYKVLDGDMTQYKCCQGYFDNGCCTAGTYGESKAPQVCLGIEACCCIGPSMSSSRMFIMDLYDLRSDPCDNRLIRLTNCLMLTACICDILAIFIEQLRESASIIHNIAQCVFYTTMGCMAAQVLREVSYHKENPNYVGAIPSNLKAPIAEAEGKMER